MTEGERTIRAGSKSFALAARLLPRTVRLDVADLYAYLRAIDDAVDLAPPEAQGAHVVRLEVDLERIYDGAPQRDPVRAAFQRIVYAHGIPRAYPDELLAGMRMDASGTRYATLDDLLRYAYRVAGTVGLMLCHVFGVREERALAHAAHLGIAMQLTNICRDVAEDLQRGRLYLPESLLGTPLAAMLDRQRGTVPSQEAARALAPALDRLLRCADRYYASADIGLRSLEFRVGLAVRTARLVYAAIGDELRRRDLSVRAGRAVVPLATKLRLAGRALATGIREQPWPRRFQPAPLRRARRFEDVVLA
jgi:phytoene synthase